MISSENEWKYDEVAQDVAYTTLLAFNDINGAHILMLSMSDSTHIILALAFIRFQRLHMAVSNYQSMFTYD